jgi:hypothetical protein
MGDIHRRIHEGVLFEASYLSESVADDASILVRITTAAGQSTHLRITPGAGGDAIVKFSEGATFSSAGTPITPTNRNRVSPNVAQTVIRHTPTVNVAGTELLPPSGQFLPGGAGFLSTPGAAIADFEEWILAPGTEYLITLTNKAGSSQPLGVSLFFYEP